jgi:hypothetical protein
MIFHPFKFTSWSLEISLLLLLLLEQIRERTERQRVERIRGVWKLRQRVESKVIFTVAFVFALTVT